MAKSLDELVIGELEDFAGTLPEYFMTAQKKAAREAIKELQQTSPKKTGEYAGGWKSKTTQTRTGGETTVYNGKKPGLAHLLEFGHPIVRGGRAVGRAGAFPHLAQAQETANRVYLEELTKLIENDS